MLRFRDKSDERKKHGATNRRAKEQTKTGENYKTNKTNKLCTFVASIDKRAKQESSYFYNYFFKLFSIHLF